MKNLLLQYKAFLLFLGKFLVSYLLLTILYQSFLNRFDEAKSEVDSFTQIVAKQTETVLKWVDANAYIESNTHEPSIKVLYQHKYVIRIIEGCNALSVIILFIAFLIAFSGRFLNTIAFAVVGSMIIHVLNIARITLLTIALYHYPKAEHILHGVVFPLIIYGVVFLLWVVWVNKFSFYATSTTKQ
ncbi:MAG: hypothetical protein RL427_744 [Bacteroidota bacterium]